MPVSVSKSMTTMLAALLLAGILSACNHDGSDPEVIGGFVASPVGLHYADSDRDTLDSMDGVALAPLIVAIERSFAADGRGASWPEAGSVYIESILKADAGNIVVNYVIEGERSSIDFEMSPRRAWDSLYGFTTREGRAYGVQLYTDLDTADSFGPWNYVSTARWFTYDRAGTRPYDGTLHELFGTYGVRTRPGSLPALGSATYEGHMLSHIRDADDPANTTALDLLRGALTLAANLDGGSIGGQVVDLRRYDYGADNPAWEALADTNSIHIGSTGIAGGRFVADWEGRDSGDTPIEDSVRGFAGTLLGAFYGPAGEEVGGVQRGYRGATATTPAQFVYGFFSAGREPEAWQ